MLLLKRTLLFTFALIISQSNKNLVKGILLPTSLKLELYSEVNFWLRKDYGNNANHWDKCTVLVVDNIVQPLADDNVEHFMGFAVLRVFLQNFIADNKKNVTFFRHATQHFTTPCTIAYYNLPSINWLGLFEPGFINLLSGGVFNSFHMFFFQNENPLQNLTLKLTRSPELVQQYVGASAWKDMELRNLKMMHHFVIISLRSQSQAIENSSECFSNQSYLISTFNFWFNKSLTLNIPIPNDTANNNFVVTITRLETPSNVGESELILFPDKWRNFNGAKLPVVTTPDTNQNRLEEFIQDKIVKTGGYTTAVMFYVLQYFNATPIFNSKASVQFGRKNLNTNRWDGIIGKVLDGQVLFSSAIGLAYDRTEVLTFGHPYHFDNVIFLTPLPKIASENQRSLDFLTRPIHTIVWVLLIIAFVGILAVILFKKSYIDKNGCTKLALIIFDILIRPMLDQSNHDNPNRRNSLADNTSRGLISIWLLSTIVLITTYRSSFIAMLLAPTIIYPPKTFLELVGSNYRIGSILYNETYMAASFNGLNNRVGMEIRSKVKGYSFVSPDCFLNIVKPGNLDVCLGIASFIELTGTRFLTDQNGRKLYKTSEDSLFPISAGCAVPKSFPHLIENLNNILDRLFDNGFIEQTFKLERIYNAKLGQQFSKQRLMIQENNNGNNEGLVIQGIHIFTLMLLSIGFGIALIILCLEFIIFYFWKVIMTIVNNKILSSVIK